MKLVWTVAGGALAVLLVALYSVPSAARAAGESGAEARATAADPAPDASPAASPAAPAGRPAAAEAPGGQASAARDEALSLNLQAKEALEVGHVSDAVLFLESARRLVPDDEVLAHNLAYALFSRGSEQLVEQDWEAAVADYRRAAELAPDQPSYRLHVASLLLQRYRLQEASAEVERVLAGAPDNPDALALRGDVLDLLDELAEASSAYEAALAALAASPAPTGDEAEIERELAARQRLEQRCRTALERTRRQHGIEADYRTSTTRFFTVRHPPQMDVLRLTGVLDLARADVCQLFDHPTDTQALVVVYPPDDFRAATGTHEWVGGLFDRKIRLPLADPDSERERIAQAFRHEFTHLLVTEMAPGCPTFVNEGLAQLAEHGRGSGMGRLVAWLDEHERPRSSLPHLADLPDSFVQLSDPDTVHLGYLLSHAFVDHVVTMRGMGAALGWARRLARAPLDEAYREAVGRPLPEEEALFRELVRTAR